MMEKVHGKPVTAEGIDVVLDKLSSLLTAGEMKTLANAVDQGYDDYMMEGLIKRLIEKDPSMRGEYVIPTDDSKSTYEKIESMIEEVRSTEKVGLWELFEDRINSLLERWRIFHSKKPEVDEREIIRQCLAEATDGFTNSMIE